MLSCTASTRGLAIRLIGSSGLRLFEHTHTDQTPNKNTNLDPGYPEGGYAAKNYFPKSFSTTKILAPRVQPLFVQNLNFRTVSMETRRLSVEGPHKPPRHESLSVLSLIVALSVIGPQSLAPSIPGPSILMSVRPSVCLSSCLPKQSACLSVCPDQFCKATTHKSQRQSQTQSRGQGQSQS